MPPLRRVIRLPRFFPRLLKSRSSVLISRAREVDRSRGGIGVHHNAFGIRRRRVVASLDCLLAIDPDAYIINAVY